MRSHITSHVALALVCGLLAGTGCGSGDDDDDSAPAGGDEPGAPCTSDFEGGCPAAAKLCYAVGTSSSCKSGGLCAGTGTVPLTCAYECAADADCAAFDPPDQVCLLGCAERLFNGFCTTVAARDDLLDSEFCVTPKSGRASIAGVTY
jgi:hypothetical protein